MIGSPVLATIVISLLFIGAGITGFSLIKVGPSLTSPQTTFSEKQKGSEVSITVRSAHEFKSLSIIHNGIEVPLDEFDRREYEAELISPEHLYIIIKAEWHDDVPETALLVHIFPDGKTEYKQTFWAQGSLTEEISIDLK